MMMNDDDEEEGENDDDDDDDEDGDDDDADLLLFGCLRTKWKNWKLGGFFCKKAPIFFSLNVLGYWPVSEYHCQYDDHSCHDNYRYWRTDNSWKNVQSLSNNPPIKSIGQSGEKWTSAQHSCLREENSHT